MYEYRWKLSGRMYPIPAQLVGEAIEDISKKHDGVTPQLLVDESREETAPMHPLFEWDNTIAAENYRIVQGREVLRSIVVVRISEDPTESGETIRAFVNVAPLKDTTERKWVPIQEAIDDPHLYDQLVNRAYQDLVAFEKKYNILRNEVRLRGVFSMIDTVLKEDRRTVPTEQKSIKIAAKANGGKTKAKAG